MCLNRGKLTRTKRFRPDYTYTLSQIDLWEVDEVVILDISRDHRGSDAFLESAMRIADQCFVPITLGGGIRSLADARRFFQAGADKIAINTQATPVLIDEIARKYGSQSCVLSIDVKAGYVSRDCARRDTRYDPVEWAGVCAGAGEILLNTVETDGGLLGYDLDLVEKVSSAVSIPVIALGGAGNWSHMEAGFKAGADACATQNIFHFTRQSMRSAKSYLAEHGIEVRI